MTALFLFSFNVKTIHSVLGKTWIGVREVNVILSKTHDVSSLLTTAGF